MSRKILAQLGIILVSALLLVAVDAIAAAQGRGHGGGVGGGGGSGMGQPGGVGVDRGLGRSSDASDGRADRGRDNASVRSDGRSDAGLARARIADENMNSANKDLQAHPGIAGSLHVNANVLRSQYQAALTQNPNLKFGQFVAATRLAHNLGRNNPNITRDAILAGLAAGKSLGRTLQDLGLSSREANEAKKLPCASARLVKAGKTGKEILLDRACGGRRFESSPEHFPTSLILFMLAKTHGVRRWCVASPPGAAHF